MAGLVPAIHVDRPGTHLRPSARRPDVDARDEPGHDGGEGWVLRSSRKGDGSETAEGAPPPLSSFRARSGRGRLRWG
ncbi:hypothetical protein D7006_14880 [Xanthobacter sp. YC-JY1]|nr:hypothetical protein D7006_14880 [Xanthobacter sp. YC-JY1]